MVVRIEWCGSFSCIRSRSRGRVEPRADEDPAAEAASPTNHMWL